MQASHGQLVPLIAELISITAAEGEGHVVEAAGRAFVVERWQRRALRSAKPRENAPRIEGAQIHGEKWPQGGRGIEGIEELALRRSEDPHREDSANEPGTGGRRTLGAARFATSLVRVFRSKG
jgi:hypothetical protein